MRRAPAGWTIVATVPPLLLCAMLWRCSVDVPFWDQWEFVDTVAGGWSWHDLWAQHNEHRLVFPKLVMLALAALSGWSVSWEIATSVALASGTFLLLAGSGRRAVVEAGGGGGLAGATVALVSWLVYSAAQWENWLWGWQLQIFLNVLAVVGCIRLLSAARLDHIRLAGGVVCAVIATYSFANGIAVWIVGAAILLTRRRELPASLTAVWAASAVVFGGAYFVGYESVPWHPAPLDGLRDPTAFVLHVLHYLGGPVGALHPGASAVAGALGIAAYAGGVWRLAVSTLTRHRLVGLAAPGLYALGCAAITAIGRAGMGSEQALASKYVTLATLLWVSIALMAAVVLAGRSGDEGDALDPATALAAAIMVCMALGSTASAAVGLGAADDRRRLLAPYPDLLRSYDRLSPGERSVLASIHPTPEQLEQHIAALESNRLSVFRTARPEPDR